MSARYEIIEREAYGGLRALLLRGENAEVELLPERGALVTRFRVGDDDLLYLDPATVEDRSKNVRGGIPVLFPLAGKPPAGSPMKQHGFARNRAWTVMEKDADAESASVELRLRSDADTLAMFPFEFDSRLTFTLAEQRLRLDWAVTNTGTEELPLHCGFHPYFRVPDISKRRASIDTEARFAYDQTQTTEVELDAPIDFTVPELDLHLLDHGLDGTVLHRGGSAPIRLTWSSEYRALIPWTLRGKDFLCVEPWTARAGALASGEGLLPVQAGATCRLAFEIGAAIKNP
jgi:galactose mutarotase-like enzyme